jgi:hypothetical protein
MWWLMNRCCGGVVRLVLLEVYSVRVGAYLEAEPWVCPVDGMVVFFFLGGGAIVLAGAW